MKENKVIIREIWKTPILHANTSKEFYHHIEFRKGIMNRKFSIRKLFLKIFTVEHLCSFRLAASLKRYYNMAFSGK